MGSANPENPKLAPLHIVLRFIFILRWARRLQPQHAFRHHVTLNLI